MDVYAFVNREICVEKFVEISKIASRTDVKYTIIQIAASSILISAFIKSSFVVRVAFFVENIRKIFNVIYITKPV